MDFKPLNPNSGREEATVIEAPPYKLYSLRSITLAAFFGSVAAAGFLMGINARRTGRLGRAWLLESVGLLLALLSWVFFLGHERRLPSNLALVASMIFQAIVAFCWAKLVQGDELEAHERAGGRWMSVFFAVVVGVALMFVMPVVAVMLVFALISLFGH